MNISNLKFIFLLQFLIFDNNVESLFNPVAFVKDKVADLYSKIRHVEKHVNVLFSPNVFEAYNYKLENMADIIDNEKFNKEVPTVIYIHGWLNNGELEESVMAIRSAYRDQKSHNFIAIDWSAYSHWHVPLPYKSSAKKLMKICKRIAEELEQIRKRGCSCYKNFYLTGHSLGAQCVGLIGRHLKKISNNKFVIPRIYALDPAGPGFEFNMFVHVRGFDSLSKSDAEYVQIIHTNAGALGIEKSVGHSDFYPNGGSKQPGCKDKSCSHQFAWIFFQQSLRSGAQFLARKCDSYKNFMDDRCNYNEIAQMGYTNNETLPMGKFYLRTHPSRYGSALSEDGIKTEHFKMILEDGRETNPFGDVPFMSDIPPNYKELQ